MAKLWCLTLILGLFALTEASAPCACGSILRIKKQAMEYACQTQRRPLQEALQLLHIPGFTKDIGNGGTGGGGFLSGGLNPLGIFRGGIIGGITKITDTVLKIAGIDIKKVQLPEMKVTLKPGVGVQVVIDTGLDIKLRCILLGGIEIQVGAGVTADLQITKTSKGHPKLTFVACKSLVGDLNFVVGGNQLIPEFVRLIRNHIHAFLADKMCLTVSNTFLRINSRLGAFGDPALINAQVGLQYSMPNPPIITEKYMDMSMLVEYEVKDTTMEHLSVVSKTLVLPPDAGSPDAMVNMGFSMEYFTNLFMAVHSTGCFNMDFSSQTVSAQDAQLLTTKTLALMIPEITRIYPESLPIIMRLTVSRAPLVKLQPGKIALQLTPALEIFVDVPGSGLKSALKLDVDLLLAATIDVSEGKLKLFLTIDRDIQLVVASSSVGQCKASNLAGYIESFFDKVFMVRANRELSIGLSLPSIPDVQLIKPVVDIQKEYVVMSCDLQYNE